MTAAKAKRITLTVVVFGLSGCLDWAPPRDNSDGDADSDADIDSDSDSDVDVDGDADGDADGDSDGDVDVDVDVDVDEESHCADDSYENASDTEESAPLYTLGTTLEGRICPHDVDFYSINLDDNVLYDFQARGWDSETTDIDLHLLNPAGTVIASGSGTSEEERFETCISASGRHLIEIIGYGDSQGPYLLHVAETAGPCCDDDDYEDNDSLETARSISCGTGLDATICSGDEDWWSFHVSGPVNIEVGLVCDEGSGDLDLFLIDSEGHRLARDTSGECDASLSVPLSVAGAYYLRIFAFMGGSGNYFLDCEESRLESCIDSSSCSAGRVCDPPVGCIDEVCHHDESSCPDGHFCPSPGFGAEDSACAVFCTSHLDCRPGYECKIFEERRGCVPSGAGQTGQSCRTFRDCADERICLAAAPTGYCAEINCTSNDDCPADTHAFRSRCVDVGEQNICLMDCLIGDSACDINPGTCTATSDREGSAAWVCVLPEHTVPAP